MEVIGIHLRGLVDCEVRTDMMNDSREADRARSDSYAINDQVLRLSVRFVL